MHRYLHVMLLILFVVSMQGCSSTEKTEEAFVLETPQIESITPSAESNVSEIVVHGKAGAVLTSLTLSADNTRLNKETNTTVKVMATFSDNSRKEVTQQVTWNMTPKNALRMNNRNLQAVDDGNVTLQATLGKIHSNSLHVNVFWEIHGYRLPPMPDEKLNNKTLLGIDSNSNGVRDDVERYLLNKYKDHHKIVSEIALQSGRAFQIVLEHPENARETYKHISNALHCNMYFKDDADYYGDPILINEYITDYKFEDIQLNTRERIEAYLEHNRNLSGSVLRMPTALESKAQCDFNVTELLKSQP